MRSAAPRLLLALVVWIGVGSAVPAQLPGLPGSSEPTAPQSATTDVAREEPAEPTVPGVPDPDATVAELAVKLERAIVHLRELRSSAEPESAVDDVERNVERVREELEAMRSELEATAVERLARRDLLDIRRRWQREERRLDGWFDTLADRARRLDAELRDVRTIRQAWEQVGSRADPALPDAMRTRVRTVLERADDVANHVDARLERVLSLMARVSDARFDVRDALERIDRAVPDSRAELFRRSAPPLWQVRSDLAALPDWGRQLVDSVVGNVRNLRAFARDRREGLLVTFGGFVLAAIAFVTARRRFPPGPDQDPRTVLAIRLLRRPYAAAALVVLTVALWSFPDAPSAFYDAVLVGLILPLLRLLPLTLSRPRRILLYVIVALWSVERLARLVTQFSVTERLVMLAVSIVAVAALGWAMRPAGTLRDALSGHWGAATWAVGRSWLAIFAIAVIANVVGAVELGSMLAAAALNGLYFALVLLGAVLSIESIVTLAMQSGALRRIRLVERHGPRLAATIARASRLLAVLLWAVAMLFMFRLWAPVTTSLGGLLTRSWTIGSFELTPGKVIAFVAALWVAVLLSRLVRFVLAEDVLTRVNLPRGVPETISMLVHYGLVAIGLFVALGVAGFELTQFAIVLGALSVGIGFGLQNVVNNFVSGLILVFERPISVGDTIEVGALLGTVRGIGIRASTIRTFDGAEVIVPNGSLLSSELVNWTLSDRQRRLIVPVGVAYGSDVELVRTTLLEAAASLSTIQSRPEPQALFQGFGDSSLDFEVRAWTEHFETWPAIRSELVIAIESALRDAGVQIPFPQRDVHLRSSDTTG